MKIWITSIDRDKIRPIPTANLQVSFWYSNIRDIPRGIKRRTFPKNIAFVHVPRVYRPVKIRKIVGTNSTVIEEGIEKFIPEPFKKSAGEISNTSRAPEYAMNRQSRISWWRLGITNSHQKGHDSLFHIHADFLSIFWRFIGYNFYFMAGGAAPFYLPMRIHLPSK